MAVRSDELRDIIAQAQFNNQFAYEHIYNRYVDMLYRYLYARCQNTTLAEEALSELWLRVVQYLPNYRIPEYGVDQAFTGWLYRIAHNLSIDMVRKERLPTDPLPDTLHSSAPGLDDGLLAQDDQRMLSVAMKKLTVEQREVIHMRFQEDRTITEVAALTGRSETAIKALQHRALGALARALGIERHTEPNSW